MNKLCLCLARTHLLGVVPTTNGLGDRAMLFINRKVHSHTRERSQNIGEKNASIGLVVSPGLQRHFDGDFGDLRTLSKGWVLFAQITVFLNVTTSLTHHPNRSAFYLFSPSGTNQEGILLSPLRRFGNRRFGSRGRHVKLRRRRAKGSRRRGRQENSQGSSGKLHLELCLYVQGDIQGHTT